MTMKEKVNGLETDVCIWWGEFIALLRGQAASPHLECLWNIYRSHWHRNSPPSTLQFKIEGSLSETDCVIILSAFFTFVDRFVSIKLSPVKGLRLYPVEMSFKIPSKSFQRRYRQSCYHGVWLSASELWQFLTTESKGHDRSSRQLFGEINASQGAQITLHPVWIGVTEVSPASTREAGWSGFEGGHVSCPQTPSTPRAALSGAFVQLQLTIGCIPPSKWGTWFAGTWNALHSIHMESRFWTVPSLLRPLFRHKRSLWHRNTEISCDIYSSTSSCWQWQRVPVAWLWSKHPSLRVVTTCRFQSGSWQTFVLFWCWNL